MKTTLAAQTRVTGRFSMQVYRNGKLRYDIPEQDNLILDNALDWILTSQSSVADMNICCFVGTGNALPDKSQTGMLGSWWSTTATYQVSNYVHYTGNAFRSGWRKYYAYGLGAVRGNIAEVGVNNATSATGMTRTRALIKDSSGNPIVLTLTAEDQLYVAYTVCAENLMPEIVTGEMSVIDPVTSTTLTVPYEIHPVGRLLAASSPIYAGARWFLSPQCVLEESNAVPASSFQRYMNSSYTAATVTPLPYVTGSYERTVRYSIAPTTGNFTSGVGRIFIGFSNSNDASFCIVFPTVKVPKNADSRMTFTVTMKFASI